MPWKKAKAGSSVSAWLKVSHAKPIHCEKCNKIVISSIIQNYGPDYFVIELRSSLLSSLLMLLLLL